MRECGGVGRKSVWSARAPNWGVFVWRSVFCFFSSDCPSKRRAATAGGFRIGLAGQYLAFYKHQTLAAGINRIGESGVQRPSDQCFFAIFDIRSGESASGLCGTNQPPSAFITSRPPALHFLSPRNTHLHLHSEHGRRHQESVCTVQGRGQGVIDAPLPRSREIQTDWRKQIAAGPHHLCHRWISHLRRDYRRAARHGAWWCWYCPLSPPLALSLLISPPPTSTPR